MGELIAGSPPDGDAAADSLQPLAQDFAERVSAYTELALPDALPPLETVDRPTWIAANLRSMRPMVEPLTERMQPGFGPLSKLGPIGKLNPLARLGPNIEPLSHAMNSVTGYLLGAQIGALTGVLSQRVLGQYDLSLLDDTVPPRLLLVAPNLAHASQQLGVDHNELVSWVTIHELTHAVQFSGAPWLRTHLGDLLRQLIAALEVSVTPGSLLKRPGSSDLRDLAERLRRGELLRVTLGEERWQLVERMQATMSLVEGHAEHVMDVVGAEVLPSMPQLRDAMTRRRGTRGLPWRVFERLLGLELKMRQYKVGRAFCDAIVAADGPAGLARVWAGPEMLPTMAELDAPQLWLDRTHVPPVTK